MPKGVRGDGSARELSLKAEADSKGGTVWPSPGSRIGLEFQSCAATGPNDTAASKETVNTARVVNPMVISPSKQTTAQFRGRNDRGRPNALLSASEGVAKKLAKSHHKTPQQAGDQHRQNDG